MKRLLLLIAAVLVGCANAPRAEPGRPMKDADIAANMAGARIGVAVGMVQQASEYASDSGKALLKAANEVLAGAAVNVGDVITRLAEANNENMTLKAQYASDLAKANAETTRERTRANTAEATPGYRIDHGVRSIWHWLEIAIAAGGVIWIIALACRLFSVGGIVGTAAGWITSIVSHFATLGVSTAMKLRTAKAGA